MSNIIDLNEARKKKEEMGKERERVRKTLSDIIMEDPSILPNFEERDHFLSAMTKEQLFHYMQYVLLCAGMKPAIEDGKIIGKAIDPDIAEDKAVNLMLRIIQRKIIKLQNEKPNND